MIITGKKFSKPEMSRVINGDVVLDVGPKQEERRRLDQRLVAEHGEYNRSILQRFIRQGFVTVDGRIAKKPNMLISEDQRVVLVVPETSQNERQRPPVIFEDENVLVLDKPAGLLSMKKGEYSAETTLENFGLLVHRLDRDTSGVVILAKNEATQKLLRKQFQDRKVKKTYYAVVCGRPKLDEAMIDLPLARNLRRPTTFQVDPNGKPAQTQYRLLRTNDNYSLLELKPTTGRTHQLRVHLKYLGVPILGDPVYGEPDANLRPTRLYLHAKELEITIPEGQRKVFQSDLPQEFQNVF